MRMAMLLRMLNLLLQSVTSQIYWMRLKSGNGLVLALANRNYIGYKNHSKSFQATQVQVKLDSGVKLEVLPRTTMLQRVKLKERKRVTYLKVWRPQVVV
jgi:hypothetical protein